MVVKRCKKKVSRKARKVDGSVLVGLAMDCTVGACKDEESGETYIMVYNLSGKVISKSRWKNLGNAIRFNILTQLQKHGKEKRC